MKYHSAASMKLPNAPHALVDTSKLRDYCLLLGKALLDAALSNEAILGERDMYGQRYVIDFLMSGDGGQAMVRSTWIVLSSENFARLTSCYVL
jgi:hypothetical protein